MLASRWIQVGGAIVAAALAAGCTTQPAPVTAPSVYLSAIPAPPIAPAAPAVSAERLIADAADRLVEAGTTRYTADLRATAGRATEHLRLTGSFDFARDRGEAEIVSSRSVYLRVRTCYAAGTVYTQDLRSGRWQATVADGPQGPHAALQAIRHASGEVRELPRSLVRGIPTRHFTTTFEPRDVATFTGSELRTVRGPQPLDVHVDEEGRLRRLQVSITDASGQTASVSVDYFDFGAPVSVRLPDPSLVDRVGPR
jgi:hypothetical protein